MSLDFAGLVDAVSSHAQASGLFDRVQAHEAKNAPGLGVTAEVWLAQLRPIPGRSGLNATSGRVALNVRLRIPMTREPQDRIDVDLAAAVDALFTAYTGDFTLGGAAAEIDLLGAYGEPLSGVGGYLEQDGQEYRIFDITVPIVLNDMYAQSE